MNAQRKRKNPGTKKMERKKRNIHYRKILFAKKKILSFQLCEVNLILKYNLCMSHVIYCATKATCFTFSDCTSLVAIHVVVI